MFGLGKPDGPGKGSTAGGGFANGQGGASGDRIWGQRVFRPAAPTPPSVGAPRPPVAMTPPAQMMTGGGQMPFQLSPNLMAMLQRFFGGGQSMGVTPQLGGMMAPQGGPSLPPAQRGVV